MIVITGETDASFAMTASQEADLAESIAEADRGDVISAAELLRRLSWLNVPRRAIGPG